MSEGPEPIGYEYETADVADAPDGWKTLMAESSKAIDAGDGDLDNTGYQDHAATGWLVTKAPVSPGEAVKLRWAIYDSGDGVLDSTVLIDNFRWLGDETEDPETIPIN